MSDNREKFKNFSYELLQKLAIVRNIPGNMKRDLLIDALILFEAGKKEELEKMLLKYKTGRYPTKAKPENNEMIQNQEPGTLNRTYRNDGRGNFHPNVGNNNGAMYHSLRQSTLTRSENRERETFSHRTNNYVKNERNNHDNNNMQRTNESLSYSDSAVSNRSLNSYSYNGAQQNDMLINCPYYLPPRTHQVETPIEDNPAVYANLNAPTRGNNNTEAMGEVASLNTSVVREVKQALNLVNGGNQSAGYTNTPLISDIYEQNSAITQNPETVGLMPELTLQDHPLNANDIPQARTETTTAIENFPIMEFNEPQNTVMWQQTTPVMRAYNEPQITKMRPQTIPVMTAYDEPQQETPMTFQNDVDTTPVNTSNVDGNQPRELNEPTLFFGNAVTQFNLGQLSDFWFLPSQEPLFRRCIHHFQGCTELIEIGMGITHDLSCKYQLLTCPHETCDLILPLNHLHSHVQLVHCIPFAQSMVYSVGTHQFTIKSSYTYLQEYNSILYVIRMTRLNQDVIISARYVPRFDEGFRPRFGLIKVKLNSDCSIQWRGELFPLYVPEENLIATRTRRSVMVATAAMNYNFFLCTVAV